MNTLGRSKTAKSHKVETQFHSDGCGEAHPAICVKVHNTPDVDATEEIRQVAWDRTVEDFWESAWLIAQNHGYTGIFSEGRSDGWLIPFYQYSNGKLQQFNRWPGQGPSLGYPSYPDTTDGKERRRFVEFRTAIEGLLKDSADRYHDLALDLAAEEATQ